jgi:hypothetical protein
MSGVIWTVEMHNIFKISLVVRREVLIITLSVEGCADLKNIVHFYRVRVTEFSTRAGCLNGHHIPKSHEATIRRGALASSSPSKLRHANCLQLNLRSIRAPEPF